LLKDYRSKYYEEKSLTNISIFRS